MKIIKPWLIPGEELKITDGLWETLTIDASFVLKFRSRLSSGRYTFKASVITRDVQLAGSQLFIDYGRGGITEEQVYLSVSSDGILTVDLYFPTAPVSIRFKPFDGPGRFSIDSIQFEMLSPSSVSLTELFRSAYERLRSFTVTLYGFQYKPRLMPRNQLARLNNSWFAQGDDPFYQLKFKRKVSPGWYMLEVNFLSDKPILQGKLYIDYGNGLTESDAEVISLISGKINKRVLFIRSKPVSFRFDPCEAPAQMTETHV